MDDPTCNVTLSETVDLLRLDLHRIIVIANEFKNRIHQEMSPEELTVYNESQEAILQRIEIFKMIIVGEINRTMKSLEISRQVGHENFLTNSSHAEILEAQRNLGFPEISERKNFRIF